jgi:hypothetical protein
MRKDTNGWQEIDARPRAVMSAALTAELRQARQKARELGFEFLDTELGLAKAFLDLAETTRNTPAARRNMENAVKALDAIGRFIERSSPELPQRQLLAQRAEELRARLLACEMHPRAHR